MIPPASWSAAPAGEAEESSRYHDRVTSRLPRRQVLLSALAVGAVVALSACGGKPSGAASSSTSPSVVGSASASASASTSPSASASASVKKKTLTSLDELTVTGKFGAQPKVTGPYPFQIPATQSKVLVQGNGTTVTDSGYVTFDYDLIDATTGKQIQSSFGAKDEPITLPVTGVITGFTKSIVGKKVGDRVLMVITSKDGYDSNGGSGDIKVGDTLVFVVDIRDASLAGPQGTAVTPPAGLPTVGKDSHGYPTVTIDTSATPPKSLTVQPLIKGTGATVAASDTILVHYREYNWSDGKLIASDYEGTPESGLLSSLLSAWQKGLVGQKVGSRVLLIAPPSDGYPNGRATPSISAGSTLVFVVDILFAYVAPAS